MGENEQREQWQDERQGAGQQAQVSTVPAGYASWPDYWKAQAMPWRTESEIDEERQRYLAKRRATMPDIEKGIYPFRDANGGIMLTRADIEWLLTTHESSGMRGPVAWDEEQHKPEAACRIGLDLRGADLHDVDLSGLPLARIRGGLRANDRRRPTEQQRSEAGVQLEGATLRGAHLEGARLRDAHLARAVLSHANLRYADLTHADLREASLGFAHLEGADLDGAHMEGAGLGFVHLERATLCGAHLGGASLANARLDGADLTRAHLDGARLFGAYLESAHLNEAELTGTDLGEAHLEGANLHDVCLEGADLTRSYLDSQTYLSHVTLGGARSAIRLFRIAASPAARLRDVHWGGVDLTLVEWDRLLLLGDEQQARMGHTAGGYHKPRDIWALEFENAVRANRQLATALHAQGLNEQANRFAYRAQLCQRQVFRRQGIRGWPGYVGSLLLWAVAGYGYRLWRIFAAYALVLVAFAAIYFVLGVPSDPATTPPGHFLNAVLVSITAIHGRVFFEQFGFSPQAWAAAIESVVGIVIEGVFVAMLVQRFFSR